MLHPPSKVTLSIIVVNLYGLKYNVQIDEVEDVINRYGIRYGRTNEKSECV